MLVLSRKVNETIFIGDIEVRVVRLAGGAVRLGITAARDVPIRRGELAEKGRAAEETDNGQRTTDNGQPTTESRPG